VLLVHGDSDEMLPAVLTQQAAEVLRQNNVEVSAHIIKGLGHGIEQQGLSLAARFLLETLKLPLPRQATGSP
jgi:phospholipase/carboxylesterase